MSIYLKPLPFLLTTPLWTLPRGDKTEVARAHIQCKLWIETAASTTLAAALVFPIIMMERNFQKGFRFVSQIAGIDPGLINLLSIVESTAFLYIVNMMIRKIDTQTAGISAVFVKIYSAYKMAMQGDWAFMSLNVLGLTGRQTDPPWDTIQHSGRLRPSIEELSQSWAPAMASLYGYRADEN